MMMVVAPRTNTLITDDNEIKRLQTNKMASGSGAPEPQTGPIHHGEPPGCLRPLLRRGRAAAAGGEASNCIATALIGCLGHITYTKHGFECLRTCLTHTRRSARPTRTPTRLAPPGRPPRRTRARRRSRHGTRSRWKERDSRVLCCGYWSLQRN